MFGSHRSLGRSMGRVPSAVEEAPSPAHAPAQLDTRRSTTVVPETYCCCQRQVSDPSIRNSHFFPANQSMDHLPVIPPHPSSHQSERTGSEYEISLVPLSHRSLSASSRNSQVFSAHSNMGHLPVFPPHPSSHPSSHQSESTDSSEDQCPISLYTLKEMINLKNTFPVLASDGHPYEYHALKAYVWGEIQKNKEIISPMTRQKLTNVRIHPLVSPPPRYLVESQEDKERGEKIEQLNQIIQHRTTDPQINNRERQEARRDDPRTTVVPFNMYTF